MGTDKEKEEKLQMLIKNSIQEATSKWLDEKLAEFGKWSLRAFGALLLGGLIHLAVWISQLPEVGFGKHN